MFTDEFMDELATRIAAKIRREPAQVPKTAWRGPRLLSVEQAADYLGRTPKAVRHLIQDGRLPAVKIDNRVQLDAKDLDHIIESSKVVAA